MFLRYTLYNLSVKQIQPLFFFYARRTHAEYHKSKLISTHQNDKNILKIFNDDCSDYLSRFKISEEQMNALKLHKEKHGSYKSLNDILEVKGMNESILDDLVHSLIMENEHKRNKRTKKSLILPSPDNISQKKLSTVLGIYVGANAATWALLGVNKNILEWNYVELPWVSKNSNTLQLLEMFQEVTDKLPISDVYTMDEISFDHRMIKSYKCIKLFTQKQQLRTIILAFLKSKSTNAETEDESLSQVYLLHHDKVAHLFGLRIGNEIISSGSLIDRLLYEEDRTNNAKESSIHVCVPKDIMYYYKHQLHYIKDQMNWSLLIALTFLQLGFHQKNSCVSSKNYKNAEETP